MSKKVVTLHDYAVGYKRVPTNPLVYHTTFNQTTVQKIIETLTEIEPDDYVADIIYITLLP